MNHPTCQRLRIIKPNLKVPIVLPNHPHPSLTQPTPYRHRPTVHSQCPSPQTNAKATSWPLNTLPLSPTNPKSTTTNAVIPCPHPVAIPKHLSDKCKDSKRRLACSKLQYCELHFCGACKKAVKGSGGGEKVVKKDVTRVLKSEGLGENDLVEFSVT